jgi:hypothetical protein
VQWFLVLYVLVAVISAAFVLAPWVATLVVFLTFGLGLVLLPAPTALIYMTALLPAVLLQRIGLGLVCVFAVAVAPGMLSRWAASSDSKAILAADIANKFSSPPRRIEFEQSVRETTGYGDRTERLLNAPCEALCQTLLLSRQVDQIRITAIGAGTRAPRGQVSVVYSYQQRSGCPSAFGRGGLALPATEMRATRGECIVAVIDAPWPSSAKIVVTQGRNWKAKTSWLHNRRSFTRFEVYRSDGTNAAPVARYTQLTTSVLSMPLVYGPVDSYGLQINLGFRRHSSVFNTTDIGGVLRDVLGLKTDSLPTSRPEPALETVNRILASHTEDKFGPETLTFINYYLDTIIKEERPINEHITLLEKLISDKRIDDHQRVGKLLQYNSNAAASMVEPLLQRLEKPVPEWQGHNHNVLAQILVQVPEERLRPVARRILAAAELSDQWHYAPLLRVVGRLGIDPQDLLLRRLNARSEAVRSAAMYGVCKAHEPWRARLMPALAPLPTDGFASSPNNPELTCAVRAR